MPWALSKVGQHANPLGHPELSASLTLKILTPALHLVLKRSGLDKLRSPVVWGGWFAFGIVWMPRSAWQQKDGLSHAHLHGSCLSVQPTDLRLVTSSDFDHRLAGIAIYHVVPFSVYLWYYSIIIALRFHLSSGEDLHSSFDPLEGFPKIPPKFP